MALVYKIVATDCWREAAAAGCFAGAAIDLADGFIHLSAAGQVEETAWRHFAGQDNLLLAAFDEAALGATLRWEASRGGDLFPHVYGTLDPASARWAKSLPWNGTAHDFPAGWRT